MIFIYHTVSHTIMINSKITIMSFVFLMAVVVSNPFQFVNAEENQTETQEKKTTEAIKNLIEELKKRSS